jgi:GNAT superfamily N-acetyltransferase
MLTSSVIVELVTDARQLHEFAKFPWRVYRDDPNWVPPVWSERNALLDRQRNPFFRRGEAEFFIARWRGQAVGTVAVGIDPAANTHWQERGAFFGLFETIEDENVAHALFSAARDWAESRDATVLRGPYDLTYSLPGGLLVEGFDDPPVILTGHTPAYYAQFVERFGFRTWGADHLAYQLDLVPFHGDTGRLPSQMRRVAEKVALRRSARVRAARVADWCAEIEQARQIYNESLASRSDFVPVSQDDFGRLGEAMRVILDPELVLFVEVEGRAVGFVVALPDVNQALRHANGLRHPWDYLKVLWYRHRIDRVSLKIAAVRPGYQGSGLAAMLFWELATRLLHKGYRWLDMSLTGEDNPQTNRLAIMAGAWVYKRYRVYELPFREKPVTRNQNLDNVGVSVVGRFGHRQEAFR